MPAGSSTSASSQRSSPCSASPIKLAVVLGGTVLLGLVAHAIVGGGGAAVGGGKLAGVADAWVVIPSDLGVWAPVSYVTLVAAALLLTTLKGWTRLIVLIPTLYLAAFVWENVMLAKPEPTRYILLGAVLVTLMVARPQGLLGEKRVEIV